MELPFGRLDAVGPAARGYPGLDRQRRSSDVARSQAITFRLGRNDLRLGSSADEQRIAVEQPVQLDAGSASDLFLAAAGEQATGKPRDGRVAGGMRSGELGLAADSGRKPAGDQ